MMKWKNDLWYSLNDYYSKKFSDKTYKVSLSAGFTCPTRDGTKGHAGCAFCDEYGSASYFSAENASQSILNQLEESIPKIRAKYKAKNFIAYFQSFTNTYAPKDYLKKVYDTVFYHRDIIGMSVGTRPDAVSEDSLDLLEEYSKTKYVTLELGVQSFSNGVQAFYERGETVEEGAENIARILKRKNIDVSIHLMFGAPSELDGGREKLLEIMKQSALKVNQMGVNGVKVHQLMILKKTILEKRYAAHHYPTVDLDDYNHGVMTFLEHLNPNIYVERTHALAPDDQLLVGPSWSSKKLLMMNSLNLLMRENNSYHGKNFVL